MPAAPVIIVDDLENDPQYDGDKDDVAGFESHNLRFLSMTEVRRQGKF